MRNNTPHPPVTGLGEYRVVNGVVVLVPAPVVIIQPVLFDLVPE